MCASIQYFSACLYSVFTAVCRVSLTSMTPIFFHDDVAAAQEEDGVVVEDFYETATDVQDMGSIRAESNEGVAEHAIGDASFLCFPSCLWGRHIAVFAYSSPRKYRQACPLLLWCLLTFGGLGVSTGHSTSDCPPREKPPSSLRINRTPIPTEHTM